MMPTRLLMTLLTILSLVNKGSPWWKISEGIRLIFSLALFFVELFVLAVILYLAGLIVVGRRRALLTDAFLISFLGTVLSTLFWLFIQYNLIALVLSIFVWLLLIKRLYETGWLGAIAVAVLAMIIYIAIMVLLALFFGILNVIIQLLPSSALFSLGAFLFGC